MEAILLRHVTPVFPEGGIESRPIDVLIRNGKVEALGSGISDSDAGEINAAGKYLAPGFLDFSVTVPDPGFEYKETVESACRAALRGGVTSFVMMPDGNPCNDNKGVTEWRLKKAAASGVKVIPAGALSKGMEGKELAEMYDLHTAGCRVFTDNKNRVRNAKLLQLALLYTKPFGGLILHTPGEFSLSLGGVMNESGLSARLGLRGIPALAEELGLTRDLFLAEYCDSPIAVGPISTAGSAEIVRKAKARGVKVTAFTSPQYLLLGEEELHEYDSRVKLDPPLRKAEDREALKAALLDGTLDFVASDHTPEDAEHKMVEFEHAAFGMTGLQTLFAATCTAMEGSNAADLVKWLSTAPRKLLNIPVPRLEEGAEAEFVLFSLTERTVPKEEDDASLSKNSILFGRSLTGKVEGVFVGNYGFAPFLRSKE